MGKGQRPARSGRIQSQSARYEWSKLSNVSRPGRDDGAFVAAELIHYGRLRELSSNASRRDFGRGREAADRSREDGTETYGLDGLFGLSPLTMKSYER